jgi:CopG antitoxin of type II toxin-antitoxin system
LTPSLPTIRTWEEIPFFPNPKEETAYWATHQLDPALMAGSLSLTEGQDSTSITLRMDPRMLSRLKRLAARRYLNYQSMMKQWIAERLEKELPGA